MSLAILIVDDNRYEREALKECINWNLLGIGQVLLAENGHMGMALYDQFSPQIVLTDIRMPEMDGMDMVRRIRAKSSLTHIVFCSAYDDFRYAQFAITQNADHYLLKPINTKELIEVIRGIVNEVITRELDVEERTEFDRILIQARRAMKAHYFRQFLLYDLKPQDAHELYVTMCRTCELSAIPNMMITVLQLNKNTPLGVSQAEGLLEAYEKAFPSLFAGFMLDAHRLLLCFHHIDSGMDEQTERMQALLAKTESLLMGAADGVALGVSGLTANVLELPRLAKEAIQTVSSGIQSGFGKVYHDRPHDPEKNARQETIGMLLMQMHACVFRGEYPAAQLDQLQSLLDHTLEMAAFKGMLIHFVNTCFQTEAYQIISAEHADMDTQEALYAAILRSETAHALLDSLMSFVAKLSERITYASRDKKRRTAYQIKGIVDNEYMNNITLKYLAQRVYMSPNYVHILFKTIFGHTVNHHLIQVRMSNAQTLLKHTDHSVRQISEMVGYANIPYFFSLFKRVTGHTPAEYRRLNATERT